MMRFRHKNFSVFLCLFVSCFQGGLLIVAGDDDIFSLLGDTEAGKEDGKITPSTPIPDLVAVASKLLKYKLPDDVFRDKTASYEVIDATTHKNPSNWLYIDADSRLLYALPSPFEQGISMLQISVNGDVIAQFTITVYPRQDRSTSPAFVPPAIKDQLKPYNENSLCTDNRIRSVVIFDQDFEKLSAKEKASLVGKMSDFLSLDERLISLSSWKGYGTNHPDTSVLAAGPGNIIGQSKRSGLEMTWHLACGEFRQLNDFTKILEHNILGGRISDEAGYPVVGWQVMTVGQRKHARLKRAVNAASTPVLTSSLPTASILSTTTKPVASTSAVLESSTVVMTSSASIKTTQVVSPTSSSTMTSATSSSVSSSSTVLESSTPIKSSGSLPATSGVSLQSTPSLSQKTSFTITPTPSSIFSTSTPPTTVVSSGEVLQSSSMPPSESSVTPSASATSALVPSLTPSSSGSPPLTSVPSSLASSAFISSTFSFSMTANISVTTSVEITSTPSFSLAQNSTDISSSALLTATPSMLDSSSTYSSLFTSIDSSVMTMDVTTTTALLTSGTITLSPSTSSSNGTSDIPQTTVLTTPVFSTTFQATSSDGSIQVTPTPSITPTSGVVLPTAESSSVVSISTLYSSIPSVTLTSAATSSDVVNPTPSAIQNQTASSSSIEMTSTSQTSVTFQSTSATFQSTSATIEPTSALILTSTPFIRTSLPSSAFESTPHLTQVWTQFTSPSFSSPNASSVTATQTESSTPVTVSTIEATPTLDLTYLTSPMVPTSSPSSFMSATSVSATPSFEATQSLIEPTTVSIQPSSNLNATDSTFQTTSIPFASSLSPTVLPTSTIPVTLTPSFDSSRITHIPSPTFSQVDSTVGPSVTTTMSGNTTYIPSTLLISSTEVAKTISPTSTSSTLSSSATAVPSTSTSEIFGTTSPTISMSSMDSVTVTSTVIYSTSVFPTSEVAKTISVTQPISSFQSVTPTSVIAANSSMTPSVTTEFSTVQMSTTPSVESSNVSAILTTVPTAMMTSSVDTLSYTAVPSESYTAVPTQTSIMSSGFTSVFKSSPYLSTPTIVITPSPSLNFSDISSTFASQITFSTTIDIQPTSSSSISPSVTLFPTSKVPTSLFSSMEPSSTFSVNFTSSSPSVGLTGTVSPSFVTSVDLSGSITLTPTKTLATIETSSFDTTTAFVTPVTVISSPTVSFETSNMVTVMPSVSVSSDSLSTSDVTPTATETDTLGTTGILLTPSMTQSVEPSLESSPVMSIAPVVTPTATSSTIETGVPTSALPSMDESSTALPLTSSPAGTMTLTMTPSISVSIEPQTSVLLSSPLPYTSTVGQTSIISTGILSSLTIEPTATGDVISISHTPVTETVFTTPVFPSVSTSYYTVPSGLLTSSASTPVLQTSSVPVASSPTPSIESSVSPSFTDITSPMPTTSVISESPSPPSTLVITSSSLTTTQSSTIVQPESSSLSLTTPLMTSIATSMMDSTVIASSSVLVTSSAGSPTPEVSSMPVPSTTVTESSLVSTMIRPSSTAVVPSSSVVVTTATPTSPVPSEPPVLVKPITTLDVPFKKYFQIQVPADMFQDPMEGSTRALSLTLLDGNNAALQPDSWVQFNQTSQTIEGISLNTAVLLSPQQFVLRAENSAGLYVTDAFVFTVNQSLANVKRNHLFSATYDIQYDSFISSVPNVITLLNRIGTYFSDGSAEKLQIDSVRAKSVVVDWYNDTLPQNTCDNVGIQDLFSRLAYNNGTPKVEFVAAMGVEYPVTNVGLTLMGSCAPTTTISPSTTTTSVPTSSVVVTTVTPTSPVPSEPPALVKPITALDVPFKKYFQIQIPTDTFKDPMEGMTRNLSLTLLDGNNNALKPESWVQFNRTSQTIEGIALDAVLADSPQQFVLRAENSAKLAVTDAFVMMVNRTLASVQRNHLFSATYDLQYDTFMSSVSNVTSLLNRIGEFFSDVSSEKIQIDAIRAGSVIIDWSNDTLLPNSCENTTINELFSRLSYNNGTPKPEFVTAMGTDYPVTNVGVNFTGSCTPVVLPYGNDGTVYIAILVPIIIVLIVIIAIVIYCICNRRQKRLSGRFLIDEDSAVYRNDRKPVFMPADLEMSDFYEAPKKPRKPLMFDNEGAENYPSSDAPYEQPVDRPEPPNYLISMDPSLRYAQSSPPPSYHSDTSNPPPSYRLPPPYKNHSKT
ncbi:mucin-2-like isoform X1 [Lineus longissimus]|uniref:mucin-2-like isoform X1 n=1 Tax=Lineus longissimus TaxID=88925 RepID=UPI002B4EF793